MTKLKIVNLLKQCIGHNFNVKTDNSRKKPETKDACETNSEL